MFARSQDETGCGLASEVALFTSSGNDVTLYPQTPFQVLYTAAFNATPEGDGLLVTGDNSFTVQRKTIFYIPVISADDSPPVAGVFPTTRHAARHYFFDQSQLGASGSEIVVDGRSTPLAPRYIAGPVDTPPLLNGGGTHVVSHAAFLSPLKPGTHTVEIRGGFSGDLFTQATGLGFVRAHFTYVVHVV